MNLNKNTLVEFETERSKYAFIPPKFSDSFYNIGDGVIDFFCEDDSDDYLFNIKTKSGEIRVGSGDFYIDTNKHYSMIKVKKDNGLVNDGNLFVNNDLIVYGSLTLEEGSSINVNNGNIVLHPDSSFTIKEGASININEGSITIYGNINVDVSLVETLLNTDGIYIDSAAVLIVKNINLGDREFSMTDYELLLRSKLINRYTQGEYDVENGKIGYTWKDGDLTNKSQILELSVIYGQAVLGDFKLSALGLQNELINNLQICKNIKIRKGTTLYISSEYNGYTYLHPEMYIGIVIGNCKEPGSCIVDGTIIVDGETSKITLDRHGSLTINEDGFVYLKNNSYIQSTNNDDAKVLIINGTLVIDDISQLKYFNKENIKFGNKGKLIILNPDNGDHRLLFSTPNGIHSSELYRLFEDKLNYIEYHIQNNTGIKIDEFFEYYNRDMTDWYNGMRIEKAIHEGLIVWHDGGFIELDHDIIPWADTTSSLLQASRLFKSTKSYDADKLQEVINHLIYAGCGNIVFRYINGDEYVDIALIMNDINMKSITTSYTSDNYILNTDNNGELFIKNNISNTSADNIINETSKMVHLNNGDTQFSI